MRKWNIGENRITLNKSPIIAHTCQVSKSTTMTTVSKSDLWIAIESKTMPYLTEIEVVKSILNSVNDQLASRDRLSPRDIVVLLATHVVVPTSVCPCKTHTRVFRGFSSGSTGYVLFGRIRSAFWADNRPLVATSVEHNQGTRQRAAPPATELTYINNYRQSYHIPPDFLDLPPIIPGDPYSR